MKHSEFKIISTIQNTNFANLFNVNIDPKLGANSLSYSINRTVNFINSGDLLSYQVSEKDTWSLISYKLYNTIALWWLVCKVNNIADPTINPEAGQKLKYLNPTLVQLVLSTIKSS